MRVCSQCGAEDRPIEMPGEEPQHFVVPQWKLAPKGVTQAQVKAGWTPRQYSGKSGMERLVCRDCLNANALRDQVWGNLRREALALERRGDEDKFWQQFCEAG